MIDKYKTLKDYTDEELIQELEVNDRVELVRLVRLGGLCSEILRRMNKIYPILKNKIFNDK